MNVFHQRHQHGDLENLIDHGMWLVQLKGQVGTAHARIFQQRWRLVRMVAFR